MIAIYGCPQRNQKDFFTLSSACGSCSPFPRASSENLSVSAGFLPYYHCFAMTSGMQIHRVGRYMLSLATNTERIEGKWLFCQQLCSRQRKLNDIIIVIF